jgi:hypothetical protein
LATIINNIKQQYAGANQWQQQYPWFSLGHLLQAASQKHTEGFQPASQKAAVYFNDVQRLHWLLYQQEINVAEILATYDLGKETITQNEEIFAVKFVEEAEQEEQEGQEGQEEQEEQEGQEPAIVTDQLDTVVAEIFEIGKTDDEAFKTEGPAIQNETEPIEEPITELETEIEEAIIPEVVHEEIPEPEPISTIISEVPVAAITTEPILETVTETEMETEQISDAETNDTETTETVSVELEEAIEMPQSWQDESYDPDDTDGPEDTERQEPELKSVMDIAAEKFEPTNMSQSLAEVSKQFKEENKEDALELPVEVYHTVDYFASQGIKLVLEPRADDKFGQQLKTFTSWLKQMKKLPATKMSDKEHDPIVENIASSSLQEGEVLTESMAEVLMKQGKHVQAIEVWQKLSLLYPEKSHYFATFIEKTKV